MTIYAYKAKDGPDRTVEGELTADSRAAALLAIDRMGYSPIAVHEKAASSRREFQWRGGRRVRPRDVTVFTRQLASLIRSGVPILRALRTIGDQTENRRMRAVVEQVAASIRDGNMLSGAMVRFPVLFSSLYLDMVRAGESAGILDVSLTRLADSREKEEEVRRKVQSAMAYPILVLVVGILTVFMLLSFFLPQVVALFKNFDDLPLPTRILIGLSNFFRDYWLWMLLLLALAVAVVNRLMSVERGRTLVDGFVLRVPFVRRFVLESEIARFARTLSLLIAAGVPIDKCLELSANTLGNLLLRDEVDAVRVGTVQKGAPLSEGLKRSRHFPAFVANMTAVGEEAGRLDEALLEVATYYEKEVEQQARLATSMIEPILILGVGAIVGFIVAAMLLPIFQLGTGL